MRFRRRGMRGRGRFKSRRRRGGFKGRRGKRVGGVRIGYRM